jgi:hypothetical protein
MQARGEVVKVLCGNQPASRDVPLMTVSREQHLTQPARDRELQGA